MIKKVLSDGKFPVKIWTDDVEEEALQQLKNLSNMPFIHRHVAVMPDVHAGRGSTIGTVIATKGAIIPSAVGVDIGCGMRAVKTTLTAEHLSKNGFLKKLRERIEEVIPVGFFANREIDEEVIDAFGSVDLRSNLSSYYKDTEVFKKSLYQMGSLGGGNHFIEICLDTKGSVWVLLHSGSRNIGKMVADKHINNAKGLMKKYFINLHDEELSYLVKGDVEFNLYIHDMNWCQNFAKYNREIMMNRILRQLSDLVLDEENLWMDIYTQKIDCHHNYSQMENHFGQNVWITRKGAVSAREGEFGIIPGSMGTKSYIVKGRGNLDAFCSCSHGAGRKMSRTQARKQFTLEDLIVQTNGVECKKDTDVLDEIPGAYKDIDTVMDNQSDLVEIVETLKQVLCIKG